MTATYRPADRVEEIAAKLIRDHHDDLEDVEIRYVFRSEHAKDKGKAVFGRARKVSGLNAHLAQGPDVDETWVGDDSDFFVIEIAEDLWAHLDAGQREALVDHELCHCTTDLDKDENVVLKIRPHDLEEFRAVVERHGLWRPDVTEFARSLVSSQGVLGFAEDEDES